MVDISNRKKKKEGNYMKHRTKFLLPSYANNVLYTLDNVITQVINKFDNTTIDSNSVRAD